MSITLSLRLLDQFPKNTINFFENFSFAIANAANRLLISLTLYLTFCLSQQWNCGLWASLWLCRLGVHCSIESIQLANG